MSAAVTPNLSFLELTSACCGFFTKKLATATAHCPIMAWGGGRLAMSNTCLHQETCTHTHTRSTTSPLHPPFPLTPTLPSHTHPSLSHPPFPLTPTLPSHTHPSPLTPTLPLSHPPFPLTPTLPLSHPLFPSPERGCVAAHSSTCPHTG